MKAPSRRDRIRGQLADLKMPGALEALVQILSGIDGGIGGRSRSHREPSSVPRISLRNNRRQQAAMRSSRLPAMIDAERLRLHLPAVDQARVSESRACTSSASSSVSRTCLIRMTGVNP